MVQPILKKPVSPMSIGKTVSALAQAGPGEGGLGKTVSAMAKAKPKTRRTSNGYMKVQ